MGQYTSKLLSLFSTLLNSLAPRSVVEPALATPSRFRLIDVAAFLDEQVLRVVEYSPPQSENSTTTLSETAIPPYAALSYPWRDLQLPEGVSTASISVAGAVHADPISIDVIKTACVAARKYECEMFWLDRLCILPDSKQDKTWQIHRMFRVYQACAVCLVFPGGLVRLARLDDPTSWIDRAWTLQEAMVPGRDKVKVVFQLTHASYHSFILHRCDVEKYNDAFRRRICFSAPKEDEPEPYSKLIEKVLEEGRSATCALHPLCVRLWHMAMLVQYFAPEIVHDEERYPIPIIRSIEARMLRMAMDYRGKYTWIAAYTRSSSRPVDMVFSIMDLLGVHLDVAAFGEGDRTKAMIGIIKNLMKAPRATATWLFIAPGMTPSTELSTLPEMPETSESGRAYIRTRDGQRTLAFEAFKAFSAIEKLSISTGEMTDSGYFVFWSKAALLVPESAQGSASPKWKAYDDRETWAVVVGRIENLNRNPETWKIDGYANSESPKRRGVYELTLMVIERHGYDLYHRVGMEREIDEKATVGWDWTYRCFQVGGPGRGNRQRFRVSPSGPCRRVLEICRSTRNDS
ncbi:hypothetical protein C8R45DRAFT_1053672 [Mycena sanguinolenta]|nr:hypothetical protein C8R45DRAFT_1053672 [Mycena sanguinolenta]